ncbi:MAG TPA: CoA transferase [Rhizomicrobium sp.]|nr:CoA transferase [Rhizomicrobium sp.]
MALFSDLLVLDCASFIAGPAAGTILSDFGARVIKIEPPGLGDSYRNLIRLRAEPGTIDYFWTLDARNKESLALDLKQTSARDVLDRLIERADVFITNFPGPVRERLRLRAQDVMPLNQRLIYASLTPYGETGPERDRTAYDTTAWWARSGLMDMVRSSPDAEPGPSMPGMGDHPTAMALYAAIVTALYKRQVTGEGGVVSTSLMANGLWSNGCQIQAALCDVPLPVRPPRGSRSALGEMYRCKDGRWFILAMANPAREWPLLARALGHAEWAADPRFHDPASRLANAAALVALLEACFSTEDWSHWRALLSGAGVTFGPIARIHDHAGDPQILANDMLPAFVDGEGLRTVDSPFHIESEPKRRPHMAPAIGQHTRRILSETDLADDQIDAMLEIGAAEQA